MSELARYAVSDARSQGRVHKETASAYRGPFQRDRDRIIHSGAFRRLEYKTQVFVNHEGDMFRTRLTHSIEVAQIARTVARCLTLNEDLVEAIALGHDLGHTPFGHAGQDALNECMREYGGFEHNWQSLRVVDLLEEKYAAFPGLNLCFETREGILKHCSRRNARELGDVGRRFLEGQHPSLEAQLANIADEIAYNHHDLDDGLRSGLLSLDDLSENRRFIHVRDEVLQKWPGLAERRLVHEVIRRMINRQVSDLIDSSKALIAAADPHSPEGARTHRSTLVGLSEDGLNAHHALKNLLRDKLYRHHRVHRMAVKAKRVVSDLFGAFFRDGRLLPPEAYERVQALEHRAGEHVKARAVADYIAGMTDRFALREHEKVFHPISLT